MKNSANFPRGFTLVEMLMAMIVALIVTAAIWTAVVSGQRSSVGIERKVTTNQDTRAALDIMATEIRMASYNPRTFTNNVDMWVNGDCSTGNQANKGIPEATEWSITVAMDIRGACPPSSDVNGQCFDGSIRTGSGNEIIRYALDAANFRITRETIVCNGGTRTSSGAQSLLGPIDSRPDVRTVRVTNGNALPLFRYYDSAGQVIQPADLAARLHQIRMIEIDLIVESADNDPNTGQPRRMAYSTSVIPRNHGIIF